MEHSLLEPTVFLVDEDTAVRESLAALIATYGLAVESCASVDAFLARWEADAVGCVVADSRLRDGTGLDFLDLLRERHIRMPVILITDDGDVNDCRRAFQEGAVDFLIKPVDGEALVESICRGVQRDIARRRSEREIVQLRERIAQLSDRERQVLRLMLEGLPNKLIAREIGLSTRTVESHRSRIYLKLEADSLAQLVRCVVRLEDSLPDDAGTHWLADGLGA